ncbi:MAG: fibronectin type III domain-containing protein [Chlorobi bacterium OLB5]|nr:MAG: fibronectin type III domain-containing protein [Chlorobi bacterium OLB5]
MRTTFISIVLISLLYYVSECSSQNNYTKLTEFNTEDINDFPKPKGHLTCEQWKQRVDSVWGQGISTSDKLVVFDNFWNKIDSLFACFHNHPINWDSLKQTYRPKIASGVSKGRFIGIMNHLTMLLKESHTAARDLSLNKTLTPGKPLFVLGGWGINNHFGAGLTPLPDSSLLVYQVVPLHPLGLERGDIVLGYDRIPWRILVRYILTCELPVVNDFSWVGSSPSAYSHSLLISAGMNWHLFDTIDVVKYSTGDTLHLSTNLLWNQNMQIFCTEQMNIPGIPKPIYDQQLCSYGIIAGTNIGYIYVWGWWGNVSELFYNAVVALMNTDGLIIDFRYNEGGEMPLSDSAMNILFDTTVFTVDFASRCSPNHQEMCPENRPEYYVIHGRPPGYQKPIAVLTGPGAVSSGDQVALKLKYHPKARFFGKSTSSAFNAPYVHNLSNNYGLMIAEFDAYQLSNPGIYLTHREFEVEENIWLSKELVRQGRDDVVEAAICWIDSCIIGISNYGSVIPGSFSLYQNYPNPFNPVTKIKFDIPSFKNVSEPKVKLIIYDMLGREIAVLVNENLKPGTYDVNWNGSEFASGVYFYKLEANGLFETKKLALIK